MISDDELDALSQRIGVAMQESALVLATAESCTGGWVSKTITDTIGSSEWFACGFTTYSNNAKSKLLGVADITLERHGAVSEETAFEMAQGALYRTDADVALAVTGIAGPDGGGTDGKPVGTVCFAWCRRNEMAKTTSRHFDGDRDRVRRQAVAFALEGLLNYLALPVEAHTDMRKPMRLRSESEPLPAPVAAKRTTPFDMIDDAKAQLTGILANLRIDPTTFSDDRIDAGQLAAEYRATVAGLAPEQREHFSQRVHAIGELVLEACELDGDAMIGYAHLDSDGIYTVLHPLHQAIFVEVIAKYLGLPPADRLSIIAATLTSNIAMLNLQEQLWRQAAPLTPQQQQLLPLHPLLADGMLRELGVTDPFWLEAVRSHHERVDGKGYPGGAEGEQITLAARLIALTDVYDAMIKPREHREPNQRAALRELFLKRGQAIDGNLAPIAIKEIGIYPPGAFVKLQNGEIAVVIKRVAGSVNPIVRSIIGPRGAPLDRLYRRNTEEPLCRIQDVVPRDRNIPLNLRRIWDYGP